MPTGLKQINVMGSNVYFHQFRCLIKNGFGSNCRCDFEEEIYASKVKPYNYVISSAGIETEPKNRCGL